MVLLCARADLQATAGKSMVDQPLPHLDLTYVDKQPDIAGKPLIVEFWATRCPPCRKSVPHLNAIYRKYKSKGLEIIGVTKESGAVIRAFTDQQPIEYPVATDPKVRGVSPLFV